MITPRTTSPAGLNLAYYNTVSNGGINTSIQGNGALAGADVLNNCVGYSQGRILEMMEQATGSPVTTNPVAFLNVDAENWYSVAQANGIATGSTPELYAVGVWYSASQNVGHVANIEQYSGGTWYISESHYYYPDTGGSWDYSTLDANLMPAFLGGDTSWALIGFIYPLRGITPTPTPTPMTFRKLPFIYYLKPWYL